MQTVDSNGLKVLVTSGLTHNVEGLVVAALAIGDGPTCLLTGRLVEKISANLAYSVGDAQRARHVERSRDFRRRG